MNVFAISDLHLSNAVNKPMYVFGNVWNNHWNKIVENWQSVVKEDDVVIIGGDVSWAMKFEQAVDDLKAIDKLNGKKIIIKGNHDYWWMSHNKLLKYSDVFPSVTFLKNDAVKIGNTVFCGSRGWILPQNSDFKTDDIKILKREILRSKISLEKADVLRTNNENLIFITHYPPINDDYTKNEFTELFKSFNVNKVIFGHIHRDMQNYNLISSIDDITYFLTSCDLVGNELVKIL